MMAGMEIDSPPPEQNQPLSPRDCILQRLVQLGIPLDQSNPNPSCLVDFVKHNQSSINNVVYSILSMAEDMVEIRSVLKKESEGESRSFKLKELYDESLLWIQWMMFGCSPQDFLKDMALKAAGTRAVCGAVWGQNDLAYRCRTCEHDPTCAICVPCFQNGNHKDHDYSIMYTGGGCCDCGDETAWKREGFCSKHKGIRQVQPLSEDLVSSVRPVVDILLPCWRDKVVSAEHWARARENDRSGLRKVANELSSAIVNMLLDFCNCSESLLSFVSMRISECSGLLDILVRAERFLDKEVVKTLHELLLKLLGEPMFKYEFAKVLIEYYPVTVNEIIKESSDSVLEKYALLPTFSVQIFTVPTLTPRLVREADLLGVLLGCLTELFLSCIGEDGRLQVNKWVKLYETTLRLVEDTRYVMSHDEVPAYIAQERPEIFGAWLRLLSLVQGMDPQKRATGIHTEEENDDLHAPFVLCYYLGNVHSLMVGGAYSVARPYKNKCDSDEQLCAEAARLPQASSTRSTSVATDASSRSLQCDGSNLDKGKCPTIPNSATWLIFECLKTIESCLELGSTSRKSRNASSSCSSILDLRSKWFRTRTRNKRVSSSFSREDINGNQASASNKRLASSPLAAEREDELVYDSDPMDISDIYDMVPENCSTSAMLEGAYEDNNSATESEAFRVLNLADWPDIEYDVSSQEISFQIPLHRFLSLMLRKALQTCYEEAGILAKKNGNLPIASSQYNFFRQVLKGAHPTGFSAYIMENPLRLRVFCAQVRAGMWRKNGDAAMLTCEWYRSVQWLEIGLEPDLFLLQCCAALAPPDLFVKRIQERFGLTNYTSLNLANHNEYESVLVQEMLTLVIQIVKERRFCGLSTVENLKRELIYKLAIGDATHSQLVKSLPRDLSKSDQLRNVLDTLAVYSKPSGMKQGKYSLRKAFWKELDLYHPRWNSRDLQVAEERYFRFCKVSAFNDQLPRWTAIFDPLSTISKIATSKSVLQIIRAVIFYAVFTETSSLSRAPDGVLITALHLLSLALDICETQLSCDQRSHMNLSQQADDLFPILAYACEEFDTGATNEVFWKNQSLLSLLVSLMRKHKQENAYNDAEIRHCDISSLVEYVLKKFAQLSPTCVDSLKRLAPEMICHMPYRSSSTAMDSMPSTSDMEERRAKARARQAAVMEKMKAEQSKFIASLSSECNGEPDATRSDEKASVSECDRASDESAPICSLCRGSDSESPLCFLVLLQKSRLTCFVQRGPISWDDADQSDKEMSLSARKGVIELSGDTLGIRDKLFQSGGLHTAGVQPAESQAFQDLCGEWLLEVSDTRPANASCGRNNSLPLTSELLEKDIYQSVIGELCGAQYSSNALYGEINHSKSEVTVVSSRSNASSSYLLVEDGALLSRNVFKNHTENVSDSNALAMRVNMFGPKDCDGIHISSCGHAVHQECHDRYLTSLKQRHLRRLGFEGGHIVDPDLGELLCPVCRRFANSILPTFPSGVLSKASKQTTLSIGGPKNSIHLPLALSLLQSTAKIVGHGRFRQVLSGKQNATVKPSLEPAIRKLCTLYSSHSFDDLSASGRLIQSLVLWDTLTYSLVSAEIAARGKPKTSSAGSLSLEVLHGELRSSNEFILSLLLRVAQTTRISNHRDQYLRFRGIQLLAGSICSGVSGDKVSNLDKRRGTLSSVLEHADKGEDFPDVLFCKRVDDPILAHDPFSSLMWALFCLPSPFISSKFFIPLVHLFYSVCVVQALLTCYSSNYFDVSCFANCVLNDVCKMMGESVCVRKYFVSNYIDASCHPKDMIRRFTFPYLRRCALLWKLLQSSLSAPQYGSSLVWELSPHIKESALDSSVTVELNAIKELEDMFQIHSLESVLNDDVLHSLAIKWCGHFCEVFRFRKYGIPLYCTPAVPFKLIQLPRLYQDLLQRYIKLQCSSCKSVPDEPALCLLCGKLCSPNWKSCCRASRCLNHAAACGAGIGVFLLVRRTTVFLQRSLRESSWPSPYLDAFGEEDRDMHRGKPLYLNEERYAALTYLVASHGLDRTSEVLRQTTINLNGSE